MSKVTVQTHRPSRTCSASSPSAFAVIASAEERFLEGAYRRNYPRKQVKCCKKGVRITIVASLRWPLLAKPSPAAGIAVNARARGTGHCLGATSARQDSVQSISTVHVHSGRPSKKKEESAYCLLLTCRIADVDLQGSTCRGSSRAGGKAKRKRKKGPRRRIGYAQQVGQIRA